MRNTIIAIFAALLLGSCSSSDTEAPETITIGSGEAPYLFTDSNGTVYLSWTEVKETENILQFVKYENEQWSAPKTIATGTDWFVNWADYPTIATENGKNMIAHYLQKSADGTYTYDIIMKTSRNGGNSWSEPFVLHDDGKEAEHGFVSIVPDGDLYLVSWLDGRNTVADTTSGHAAHGHGGAMTLRAAVLSPIGEKLQEWELDNRVCDCCQTSVTITEEGAVVAYRDRSKEEIRDISVTRLVDSNWTTPSPLHEDNWKIAGCPVNGPRLAALGNAVAAAWFTGAEGKPSVKLKFSKDGGANFGEPIILSEEMPVGRVDVIMIDSETAMVSWMEGAQIMAAKANEQGKIIEKITVASSSTSRSSGFPQMTRSGDEVLFAWTDAEEESIKVRIIAL